MIIMFLVLVLVCVFEYKGSSFKDRNSNLEGRTETPSPSSYYTPEVDEVGKEESLITKSGKNVRDAGEINNKTPPTKGYDMEGDKVSSEEALAVINEIYRRSQG